MNRGIAIALISLCGLIPSQSRASQPQSSSAPDSQLRVSFPYKPWAVELDAPGFVEMSVLPSNVATVHAAFRDSQTHVSLSIELDNPERRSVPIVCPAFLEKKMSWIIKSGQITKETQLGSFDVLEIRFPPSDRMKNPFEILMGCAMNDGIYVEIQLNKGKFAGLDSEELADVLKAVHFAETTLDFPKVKAVAQSEQVNPPELTSLDYLRQGGNLYIMQDYSDAVVPYQKAFDLEKINPQLPKADWFRLLNNLGLAYEMIGDLPQAMEIFTYGAQNAPEYPIFQYDLATYYAERGERDKTVYSLNRAFLHKENILTGETMPDPRQDDSFQEFMKDKKFRDFVDTLVAGN
jgi:hypothetical protein